MSEPRVVVFGSINADIVATAPTLPKPGETVAGTSLAHHTGGKGANQAVAAARSGARTLFVGAVGEDQAGGALLGSVTSFGVETTYTVQVPDPTGTALIVVDQAAENQIVVVAGANDVAAASQLVECGLGEDDIVVLQLEVRPAESRAAIDIARAAGARTIINAAPARGDLAAIVAGADVVVVNESELAAVCGATEPPNGPHHAAAMVAQRWPHPGQQVVATLGADGAIVTTAGSSDAAIVIPAYEVDAVDTTGAGDCFVGVLAASMLAGMSLKDAATRAGAAAAICVTRTGAAAAMPNAAEIEAAIAAWSDR